VVDIWNMRRDAKRMDLIHTAMMWIYNIYIQVWIFLNKYRPLANHNLIFVILRDRKLRKDSNLMICCEKHA
jgi:hypothetical protein